jgi:MinD-like ATPase involved in chromosome partitioning or flagellar assembly
VSRCARRLLISGLPAGAGASAMASGLAEALAGLGRSVIHAAPLKDLPPLGGAGRPAHRLDGAVLFPQEEGLELAPLELLDAERPTESLLRASLGGDWLVVDRFTGLRVEGNPWYALADELLLVVDGRPGQDTRALLLLGHIFAHWPQLPVSLLFNRLEAGSPWQVVAQRFGSRLLRHFGRELPALGGVQEAYEFGRAHAERRAITRLFPNHPAARTLRQVARQLLHLDVARAQVPAWRASAGSAMMTSRTA